MSFGEALPEGRLPVYSVSDEEEARALISLACPTDGAGQHYSRELAAAQTPRMLDLFSDRLDAAHDFLRKGGKCRCQPYKEVKHDFNPQTWMIEAAGGQASPSFIRRAPRSISAPRGRGKRAAVASRGARK